MADFAGMSIENMSKASYLLLTVSGVLAVSAVILFFALNIPKCLRMVSGKFPVYRDKNKKEKTEKRSCLQDSAGSEETLLLGSVIGPEYGSEEETLLLNNEDIERDTTLCPK